MTFEEARRLRIGDSLPDGSEIVGRRLWPTEADGSRRLGLVVKTAADRVDEVGQLRPAGTIEARHFDSEPTNG